MKSDKFAMIPREADSALLGDLSNSSGFMGVLWAPENGRCIRENAEGRPTGDMALDDGGWVFRCSPGMYTFWHDEVQTLEGAARRCWIEWKGP
jgi:hypothetical protein